MCKTLIISAVMAFVMLFAYSASAQYKSLPRNIIALYDSAEDENVRENRIHRYLEMPLNYLGYTVSYHDVNAALPAFSNNDYAVAIWFLPGTAVHNPDDLLNWLEKGLTDNRKLILLENFGINPEYRTKREGLDKVNRIMNHIGMRDFNQWIDLTYQSSISYKNPDLLDFERKVETVLPEYLDIKKTAPDAISHLKVMRDSKPDLQSDMIVTSKGGGYIAQGYALYGTLDRESSLKLWYVNPFKFLRMALGDEYIPKPDVTTLNGRRILYSHIDGDGWNNISQVEKYRGEKLISSEVVREEILKAYPDIVFNVGIIASEILPNCYGLPQSADVARSILALPNVEPSAHTHSHPLYWDYFAKGNNAENERKVLHLYPARPSNEVGFFRSLLTWRNKLEWDDNAYQEALKNTGSFTKAESDRLNAIVKKFFNTPRSYACEPFNKDLEIRQAVDFVNTLAPADKKVKLYQWSGDTAPFEEAIRLTREAGVLNLNGGDSRYDPEFPSYAWVSPIGIKLGNEVQIYSSNSNENTYTNLWRERYYGFRYLKNTVFNTDNPIRIKPFNLYFHMFSGEKNAGLSALKENLDFARTQDVISITASRYAAIADGFFKTEISQISPMSWKIMQRGELNTIRFDNSSMLAVDFDKSQGVIGQKYLHGSLYVALDKSYAEPVISLAKFSDIGKMPESNTPYLLSSNWEIYDFTAEDKKFSFATTGLGAASMWWKVPTEGKYAVNIVEKIENDEKVVSNYEKTVKKNGSLNIAINEHPNKRLLVTIELIY